MKLRRVACLLVAFLIAAKSVNRTIQSSKLILLTLDQVLNEVTDHLATWPFRIRKPIPGARFLESDARCEKAVARKSSKTTLP